MSRFFAKPLVLLVLFAGFACQSGPEAFPSQLDAALATGKLDDVLPLLTENSRSAVGAMRLAKGEGANPFLPVAGGKATELLSLRTVQEGVLAKVKCGDKTAQWVLRQEHGKWRLDLLATSNRRSLL
ncbi:MAG: hypothetical protein KC502_10795 [Myxococcales bacterium]|nr:hypothetical protein [Myxococcales bacterium]